MECVWCMATETDSKVCKPIELASQLSWRVQYCSAAWKPSNSANTCVSCAVWYVACSTNNDTPLSMTADVCSIQAVRCHAMNYAAAVRVSELLPRIHWSSGALTLYTAQHVDLLPSHAAAAQACVVQARQVERPRSKFMIPNIHVSLARHGILSAPSLCCIIPAPTCALLQHLTL